MNRILEIVFCIISFSSFTQEIEVKGIYVHYESGDSSANYSFYHSTTVYNSQYKKIYEVMRRELNDENSSVFFEDSRLAPELIVKGFVNDNDTSKYIYTQNCATGKKYIIENGDTNYRYMIECVNNEVVKIVCVEGFPTTDTLIKIDNGEYWKTTLPNGKIKYSFRQFDQKGRTILYRSQMENMNDSTGNFSRYKYDDENYIETVTSSSVGVEDKYATIVKTYCDEMWIPLKKEVIEINDGFKTIRIFEYSRVK